MVFIDDVKKVLTKSWAVHLSVLSAVLGALAEFQQQLPGIQGFIPARWYAMASIVCALAVPLARVVRQETISGPRE